MKILISVDMEGITGVTTWDQVTPGHAEYLRFRRLMTADTNAAVRGAFDGGAEEVVVSDGHWNGSNLVIEEIDSRAILNTGSPSPSSMMQGIDQEVHGVLFVGYHARQGSANAVLDHTWSSTCVANLWLNEQLAGEYTLNAALAGHYGIPVLMATGDQTACAQIVGQLGAIETAIVKQATGRYSAQCLSPNATASMIEQSAQRAVRRLIKKDFPGALILKAPIRVSVELFTSDMADRAMHMPGASRDGLRLSFTAENMPIAFAGFRSLVLLSYPR
jgi:D-amino peptidase